MSRSSMGVGHCRPQGLKSQLQDQVLSFPHPCCHKWNSREIPSNEFNNNGTFCDILPISRIQDVDILSDLKTNNTFPSK